MQPSAMALATIAVDLGIGFQHSTFAGLYSCAQWMSRRLANPEISKPGDISTAFSISLRLFASLPTKVGASVRPSTHLVGSGFRACERIHVERKDRKARKASFRKILPLRS